MSVLGPSHVAYENWSPLNTTLWTGALAVPMPVTSCWSAGASTLALDIVSPGRGM